MGQFDGHEIFGLQDENGNSVEYTQEDAILHTFIGRAACCNYILLINKNNRDGVTYAFQQAMGDKLFNEIAEHMTHNGYPAFLNLPFITKHDVGVYQQYLRENDADAYQQYIDERVAEALGDLDDFPPDFRSE